MLAPLERQLAWEWRLPPIHTQTQQWLKVIATLLMVADHVHLVFFERSETWLFWVTRLVFPMFMLLAAYNLEQHQAKGGRYLVSLVLFGSLAQPFYMSALGLSNLNVMFTLAVGVVVHQALTLTRGKVPTAIQLLAVLGLVFVPFGWLEGGWAGVLLIPAFANLFRRGAWWDWVVGLGVCAGIPTGAAPWWLIPSVLLVWCIAANFKLKTPESKPSRWVGLALYAVYPLHLGLIQAL
jgi:TraX protein